MNDVNRLLSTVVIYLVFGEKHRSFLEALRLWFMGSSCSSCSCLLFSVSTFSSVFQVCAQRPAQFWKKQSKPTQITFDVNECHQLMHAGFGGLAAWL
jgi:hypothetical protein